MNKIITFSKLVIMFDSDVIAVPWRENLLIIFLHKKRGKWREDENGLMKKMNEEIEYLKLVRWGRREKCGNFIGTTRGNTTNWWFHWNKSWNFGRECQQHNTNVTAPIVSTTLDFYFSLPYPCVSVCALDFTRLYKLFFYI